MKRGLLIALMLTAFAALGQQHPNALKGFNANSVYQFNDYDAINAFNGNLTIRIPLGAAYPITSDYSVQLALYSNSNVWEPHVDPDQQCSPDGNILYTVALAHRRANAGMGWVLSLGRLFGPSHFTEPNEWIYESPDGADHRIGSDLSTTAVTADGSYLRRTADGDGWKIQFPDGMVHSFVPGTEAGEFVLRKISRAGVDLVRIDYDTYEGQPRWRAYATTSLTPFLTVTFGSHLFDGAFRPMATSVAVPGPNGTTSRYDLTYESRILGRPFYVQPFEAKRCYPRTTTVAMLKALTQPDATRYDFGYHVSTSGAGPAGLPTSMTLPTGGKVGWIHGPSPKPDWSATTFEREVYRQPWGVSHRSLYPSAASETASATWTYTNTYDEDNNPYNADQPGDSTVYQKTTVTEPPVTVHNPDGTTTVQTRKTENYFNVASSFPVPVDGVPAENGPDYGRPFATVFPNSSPAGTRWLSQQIYEGTVLRQSKYVQYEDDDSANVFNSDVNARVRLERLIDHESARIVDTDHSGWDDYGHYETTTVTERDLNQSALLTRTSTTNYLPPLTPAQWLTNLFTSTDVTETPVGKPSSSAHVDYCFDRNSGALLRKRTRRGASAANTDLLAAFNYDTYGNVTGEAYYGGDATPEAVLPAGCDDSLPASPRYALTHAYSQGVRSSSQYTGVAFKSLNLEIDASSRLPVTSTDPAGVVTRVQYDVMGRIVGLYPQGSAWTEYAYSAATASAAASVVVRQFPENTPSSASAALTESRYYYDGFGRLTQASRRLPAGWSTIWTAYDGVGRTSRVSAATSTTGGGAATFPTSVLFTESTYDAMGRVRTVKQPDGKKASVFYSGRLTDRTSSVATDTGNQDITTRERVDGLGRLVEVTEDVTHAPLVTTYDYDVGNRLRLVTMGDQTRTFTYDHAGLLTKEQHPESGETNYQYDARGHVISRTNAAGSVVRNEYDAAERLLKVFAGTTLLKQFSYDRANSGDDRSMGKLDFAFRDNQISLLPQGGVARVKEQYHYTGGGGRVSKKITTVTLGSESYTFSDSYDYDPLGDLLKVGYPDCVSCAIPGLPSRSVTATRERGLITNIAPYTTSIAYAPSGALQKIEHRKSDGSIGPVYTHDTDVMGRTSAIKVTSFCDDLRGVSLTTSRDISAGVPRDTPVTITATADGTATSWKWYRRTVSGDTQLASTSNQLTVNAGDAATYFARAFNDTCAVDSPEITIVSCQGVAINAPDRVTAGPQQASVATALQGATYVWTIANGTITSAANGANITFTANCSGSVELNVSVTSACGTSLGTKIIAVVPATFTVTGSKSIPSAGNTDLQVQLEGSGPWLVKWADEANARSYSASPAIRTVSVTQTTTYTVTSVTTSAAGGSCALTVSGSNTATITVGTSCNNTPVADFSRDDGETTPMIASRLYYFSIYPDTSSTYRWSVQGGTIQQGNSGAPWLTTVRAGCSGNLTVTLTVTSACGISTAQSKVYAITPGRVDVESQQLMYTPGGTPASIVYDVNAAVPEITWSDGFRELAMVNAPTERTRAVTPSATTTYHVTSVRDFGGCTGQAFGTTTVTVCPKPAATITAPAGVVALESRTASVTPTAGASYQWQITNGDITGGHGTSAIDFKAACGVGTVTLTLTVTMTPGCGATNTGTVTIPVSSPTGVVSGSTTIAQGSSATVRVTLSGVGPWKIRWSDEATDTVVTSSPHERTVQPLGTTTYTLSAVSYDDGCPGVASGSAVVTVVPAAPAVTAVGTSASVVRVSWTHAGSADSFEVYRDGVFLAAAASPYNDTVPTGSAHMYSVVAIKSGTRSAQSVSDLAVAKVFSQPLIVDTTVIGATDLYELRDAVNAVRVLSGLGAYSFSDATLVDIWVQATHANELRTVLNDARLRLGLPPVATPVAVGDGVYASTFIDLRGGVQ